MSVTCDAPLGFDVRVETASQPLPLEDALEDRGPYIPTFIPTTRVHGAYCVDAVETECRSAILRLTSRTGAADLHDLDGTSERQRLVVACVLSARPSMAEESGDAPAPRTGEASNLPRRTRQKPTRTPTKRRECPIRVLTRGSGRGRPPGDRFVSRHNRFLRPSRAELRVGRRRLPGHRRDRLSAVSSRVAFEQS